MFNRIKTLLINCQGAASKIGTLGSSKQSVCAHFSKDQNCDNCLRMQIARASCRRRITVAPKEENLVILQIADHKVFSEGCESRQNHRYAVMAQDWTTQWLQKIRKPKVIYSDNS